MSPSEEHFRSSRATGRATMGSEPLSEVPRLRVGLRMPTTLLVKVAGGAAADLADTQQLRRHPLDGPPVLLLSEHVLRLGQHPPHQPLRLVDVAGALQGQVLGIVAVTDSAIPGVVAAVARL